MSVSFTNLENRNEFRPYYAGMTNRDASMASIVLLQKPPDADTQNKKVPQNKWLYDSFRSNVAGTSIGLDTDPEKDLDTLNNQIFVDGYTSVPNLRFDDVSPHSVQGNYYGVFNNFGLTNVSESREELVRINMNFGGNWNAFFFGENPRVFTFQGFLLDSPEYPYYQEFLMAYDKYLSGRRCIANGMEIVLTYDGRIVSGYLLKLISENSADQYNMKSFAFTVLVKGDNWFRLNLGPQGKGLNYMDNTIRYGDVAKSTDNGFRTYNTQALPGVQQQTIPSSYTAPNYGHPEVSYPVQNNVYSGPVR